MSAAQNRGGTGTETNIAITVFATPLAQRNCVSDDGAETAYVGGEELSRLDAKDLQRALRLVPGVTVSRHSPLGSYGGAHGGSIYIRGVGTGRPGGEIRTYTDGAPRENGVWSHPLMDAVPVDFAEGISVHKNPQPQNFPNTFGAVNTVTKRRKTEGSGGEISSAYGRFNTFLFSAEAGAKESSFDAYGGTAYKHSDGHRRHSQASLANSFARFGADLSSCSSISFIYHRSDSSVEDPGEKGKEPPVYDRFDLSTDLYTVRIDTERDNLSGYQLVYVEHGAIEWRKDHLVDGVMSSPAGSADTTWLNWGYRGRYDLALSERFTVSGALDVGSEGGHTANCRFSDSKKTLSYKGRFNSASPYLGLKYEIPLAPDWSLVPSAGTRVNFHDVYEDEWSPSAALTLRRKDGPEFFVNASRAVHYPGIYTRAVSDDFASKSLDAETMQYVSGGIKTALCANLEVLASLFYTDIGNRIDKTPTGYLNSGSMRATGVELSGDFLASDDLTAFFSGTFTNPETSPVSRLPKWTFSCGIHWKVSDYLRWSFDAQYLGSMNAYSVRSSQDRLDLRKIGEMFLVNTRLSVPFSPFCDRDGEVYLSLENLLNRHDEYYPGYEIPGVVAYFGIKLKF